SPFARPPAQFIEDAARFLQNVLVRNLDVTAIIGPIIGERPAQRVALAPLAPGTVGRSDLAARLAQAVADLVLELRCEIARRLLQLVERVGLRTDRLAGAAAPERTGCIAHGALGPPERFRNIA